MGRLLLFGNGFAAALCSSGEPRFCSQKSWFVLLNVMRKGLNVAKMKENNYFFENN